MIATALILGGVCLAMIAGAWGMIFTVKHLFWVLMEGLTKPVRKEGD